MSEYTLYVDVWLLRLGCNFLFEYLLLWAAATLTASKTRPLRLSLAALAGTLHYFFYLLASLQLIPYYGLLRFFPVVIASSVAMLLIAFYPLSWQRLVRVGGFFYGIGFIAAGAGIASAYLFGDPSNPQFYLGTLISSLTILLLAELGWGAVHERMVNRIYQIPLEISCNGTAVGLKALVDTGNNLKDPLNRRPVIIVEKSALEGLLPPEFEQIIAASTHDQLAAIEQLAELEHWQERIRLIPFNSIGKKNGLLIGFRPDAVKIGQRTLPKECYPTIAIHPDILDPQGEYRALVPPTLAEDSPRKGGQSHVETSPLQT